MGVAGLKTFLEQYNRKYLESLLIRNQYLVIDGSNLQFYIYFKASWNNSHLFGGDFNLYANNLREFFTELRECLITPVVIVDGSLETEKMKTVLKRFQNWLAESLKIDAKSLKSGKHNHSVWMSVIFHEVLGKMNILQLQTEWDADDTIALVAKFLKCPILSCDSDFYIYDDVSVVSIEKCFFKNRFNAAERIQMNMNMSSKKKIVALFCECLRVKKLWETEFHITDTRMLSLMAAMLGNDYIPTGTFNRILHQIDGWDFDLKNREKILLAMKWIKKQTSFDTALNEMLTCVPLKDRQHINEMIIFIMKGYLGEKGETTVLNMVKAALNIPALTNSLPILPNTSVFDEEFSDEEEISDDDAEKEIQSSLQKTNLDDEKEETRHNADSEEEEYLDEDQIGEDIVIVAHDTKVPTWFLELHHRCLMPTYLLKIAYNHAVFLYPQLELVSLPNSHSISIPIIQTTAGIILGADSMVLVTQEGNKISKVVISTVTKLGKLNLPCLLDQKMNFTHSLSVENRQKIVLAALCLSDPEIKFFYQWPKSMQLIVACILFFVKKVKTPSSLASAIAVIICCADPQYIENEEESSTSWRDSSVKPQNEFCQWLNEIPGKKSKTRYFYKKIECKPMTSDYVFRDSYDKEKVYDYTQFKNVLYHATMLNKLLGNSFETAAITKLNCYIIYNVIAQLVQSEYRFMDFVERSFDGGRLHLLKHFVTFIGKENQIHLNGYFKKSANQPKAKIEKNPQIKPNTVLVRNKNGFALLMDDDDSDDDN